MLILVIFGAFLIASSLHAPGDYSVRIKHRSRFVFGLILMVAYLVDQAYFTFFI